LQNNTFLTLFVGHNLVKLQKVDSTNTYLKNLLSNSKPLMDGTVIMAEQQFAGRGQKDNIWESESGKNLTFSIYLKSSFLTVEHQFDLNKAISLGIRDCLKEILGENCRIKWPNDLYYHNKKIGGILIENVIKGHHLKESIIGIGLNVNQIEFNNELAQASSIAKVLNQNYSLEELLTQICKYIECRYLQLKAGNIEILAIDYQNSLYQINEFHDYKIDEKIVSGKIIGVTTSGKLALEIEEQIKEFDLKTIKFIHKS